MKRLAQFAAVVVIAACALIYGIAGAYYRIYTIPTGAMENTLLIGDSLVVQMGSFKPKRGDLVVHRYPLDPRQTFVKRVVAVPGDHVKFHNKRLILNGSPQNEPYAIHTSDFVDSYRDNFPADPTVLVNADWLPMIKAAAAAGELAVPPGKYFVMGDNRDNSFDSRYWGFIGESDILGRPLFVPWSIEREPGPNDSNQSGRIRSNRFFHRL